MMISRECSNITHSPGGGHQKDLKISQGEKGVHKKITEDHNHKGWGGGTCKIFSQNEGAHKGNNYYQDQFYQWMVEVLIKEIIKR